MKSSAGRTNKKVRKTEWVGGGKKNVGKKGKAGTWYKAGKKKGSQDKEVCKGKGGQITNGVQVGKGR